LEGVLSSAVFFLGGGAPGALNAIGWVHARAMLDESNQSTKGPKVLEEQKD